MYEYRAKYISNYDGDTIKFEVDLGFNITHKITVRLMDIDCYELNSKDEKESRIAKIAKDFVNNILSSASRILIKTHKDSKEKYGRYLAEIEYANVDGKMRLLNNELMIAGLAKSVYP